MVAVSSQTSRDISAALSLLTAISGRILQVTNQKARVALGAATNAATGTAVAASVMGLVGSLGTASTGTAIASLSGAAASTASLFWLGGLVGGGVAAGTVVLGTGALGAGIYGSVKVRRAILGHARRAEGLSDREQRILQAVHAMVAAIQQARDSGNDISAREVALFSKVGITPLLDELADALSDGVFADLKIYNRARLRGHVHNLRTLKKRLEAV